MITIMLARFPLNSDALGPGRYFKNFWVGPVNEPFSLFFPEENVLCKIERRMYCSKESCVLII